MIGKKIKQRREELGLSQEQLANLIGVGKTAISNYETNVSSPKETILLKLFDALKCDANFLYEDFLNKDDEFKFKESEKRHIQKYRTLDEHGTKMVDIVLDEEYDRCMKIEEEEEEPKISIKYSFLSASAGTGNYLDDENTEWREYPDTPEARQADVVIPVDGDSMEPMFYDGDELYVRLQPSVNIGEIGIFRKDDQGYVKKAGQKGLISLNPKYKNIYAGEGETIECIGKVIGKVEKE